MKDGTRVGDGRCGEFVNDYISDVTGGAVAKMFTKPINVRKTQTNSDTPTV